MNPELEGVLLVKYATLGTTADQRLKLLSALGTLLVKPLGFYTPTVLGLSPYEWTGLKTWLKEGYGKEFWRLEPQGIQIYRVCEKHIVVGTAQLIVDLREVMREIEPIEKLELVNIWSAARRYVHAEIGR